VVVNSDIKDPEDVAMQLICKVSWLHSVGIYHCDIMPPNILYQAGHVQIIDWGLAALDIYKSAYPMYAESARAPDHSSVACAANDIWGVAQVLTAILPGLGKNTIKTRGKDIEDPKWGPIIRDMLLPLKERKLPAVTYPPDWKFIPPPEVKHPVKGDYAKIHNAIAQAYRTIGEEKPKNITFSLAVNMIAKSWALNMSAEVLGACCMVLAARSMEDHLWDCDDPPKNYSVDISRVKMVETIMLLMTHLGDEAICGPYDSVGTPKEQCSRFMELYCLKTSSVKDNNESSATETQKTTGTQSCTGSITADIPTRSQNCKGDVGDAVVDAFKLEVTPVK
jgi:serine/threonine protein kinase